MHYAKKTFSDQRGKIMHFLDLFIIRLVFSVVIETHKTTRSLKGTKRSI